jgi:hypothetical protein
MNFVNFVSVGLSLMFCRNIGNAAQSQGTNSESVDLLVCKLWILKLWNNYNIYKWLMKIPRFVSDDISGFLRGSWEIYQLSLGYRLCSRWRISQYLSEAFNIIDMTLNMKILMFHSFVYPVKCHWKLYDPQDVTLYIKVLLTDCAYLCFLTTMAIKSAWFNMEQ